MKILVRILLFCVFTAVAFDVSAATFLGFNTGPFYTTPGTINSPTLPTALQVIFDGPVDTDTFVTINSSDSSNLIVSGGGVTVLAGQSSATVLVTSLGLANVTLTASLGPDEKTTTVSVVSEIPVIPTLKIERIPNAVRLSWPTNATGFLLETNNSVSNASGWGVYLSSYAVLNTNFVATNAVGASPKFFRLRKP